MAWDFLLGVDPQIPPTQDEPNVPQEPSDLDVPSQPISKPSTFHQTNDKHPNSTLPSRVSDTELDDETIDTYDYNAIIKPSSRNQIPTKVQLQESSTDNTVSTESINPTPFLSAASNKALPKYSAKVRVDINEFIYKLRIFLQHPSINNCHLDEATTEANAEQSRNPAALLSMCLSGNAIAPFIDNPRFDDHGIEMLRHLMDLKHPISKTSASTLYNSLTSQSIKSEETFDAFAKRLRLMYKTCT